MNITETLTKIRSGFHRTFWVANILELFERLAFYGSKAILTVYLVEKVGLTNDAATLVGLFTFLIFALPIIAGVFVDRYGFKRTLMTCFAIFTLGYFLIGMAGMAWSQEIVAVIGKKTYVILALILTALGGSLIKPCIVGTVAKTSLPEVKSLGFSVYYTLVNLGGAIGPIIALEVRQNFGIEFVLVMSSFTSLCLFFGAAFLYQEPEVPGETTQKSSASFGQVFKDMLMVFLNGRFVAFLVIFSGFWIMFWQFFYSFPFYVKDVLKFEKFELLSTINSWTIILVSVVVTALVKRLKPITAMSLGFVLASSAWLVMGAAPTVTVAILASATFALGEATQAPRFYEYVSSLAPKDQVGTYMGFAFLPVALGALVAGPLADWLRHTYLEQTVNPGRMWYVLASIGFVTTILMIGYNFFFVKQTEVA